MPVMSLNMNTLASDLGRFPTGVPVHLSVLTPAPPTEAQMQELMDSFTSGGIQLLSSPKSAEFYWDGYQISGIDLNFINPGAPAPGTVGLLPLLLGIGILALAFGYIIWKGGEITEDAVQRLVKMAIPLTLIIGAIYLLGKSKNSRSRS
jgi:hypothetical protein